jgi:hypothetical protein
LLGGSSGGAVPLGQLVAMPLMSKISKLKSAADCILALHPRRGYVTLWQVSLFLFPFYLSLLFCFPLPLLTALCSFVDVV